MPQHPPFKTGDPLTKEYARRGARAYHERRRIQASADPLTKGLLGDLLTYTTGDWMDRLRLTGPSWDAWRVVGRVLDNALLNADEAATYLALTGRTTTPDDLRELWVLAGRGGGKSTFCAVQALRAACRAYPDVRGIPRVLVLAFAKEQAGIAFEFVEQFLDRDAELRRLVRHRTRTSLALTHGVTIQTIASNWRIVRGYSVAAALLDEAAYWWNDDASANPAEEIVRALRPGLGKVPGARLLVTTTPWTQEGIVFDVCQRYHGDDAERHILVVRAPTLALNPSFDRATIDIERARDPESAASEYDVAWRVAGGTLVRAEVLDAAIDAGIVERAPEAGLAYTAAVDLSGGTGEDSAALSIQHVVRDDAGVEVAVQDLLMEWEPPFDPGLMVAAIVDVLARYGIAKVTGDQFSAGFAGADFRRYGIRYVISERKSAECVLDALATLNTGRVCLLDVPKARRQWLNVRRDYASGGRPTIVETKRHDDLAVVTARGIVACLGLGPKGRGPVLAFR